MGEWVVVARLADLPEGSTRQVEVDGAPVCLYNVGGQVCATQDSCTHAHASLADGWLEDGVIECPLHQATFDVRTGKVLSAPATEDLRVYAVDVDGGDIRILRENP